MRTNNPALLSLSCLLRAFFGSLALTGLLAGSVLAATPDIDVRYRGASVFSGGVVYADPAVAGAPMTTLTLEIGNTGTVDLTGVTALVSGGGFTATTPAATVAPAANTSFDLNLTQNAPGTYEGAITINSNDPDEDPFTLTVRCVVQPARFANAPLVINEYSSGSFMPDEYIEFVVVGEPGTCRNIAGTIFDDNSGRGATCGAGNGISTGHFRFADHQQWRDVKVGAMIVVYNDQSVNVNIPPQNDYFDSDNDYVYFIPISNNAFIEGFSSNPSFAQGAPDCNNFAQNGSTIDWSAIEFADFEGDLCQIAASDGTPQHTVAYGLSGGSGADIEFAAQPDGSDQTFFFNNAVSDDPYDVLNWSNTGTTIGATPGQPNNPQNGAWLDELRLKVFQSSLSGQPCSDEAVSFTTNGVSANQYLWTFNNAGNDDEISTEPVVNFAFPAPGTFNTDVEQRSSGGSCAVFSPPADLVVNDCQVAVSTNISSTVCIDNTNPGVTQIPYVLENGTPDPGNVFTAELSDASGSFASPSVIGTVAATTSGNINISIPAGLASGNNYRIRINSSSPASTGAPTAAFTIINTDQTSCSGSVAPPDSVSIFARSVGPELVIQDLPLGATIQWNYNQVDSAAVTGLTNITGANDKIYRPLFDAAGAYWVKAEITCACGGGTVFTNAVEVVVKDFIAYQGGEPGDCWEYLGRSDAGAPRSVRVDAPDPAFNQNTTLNAKTGDNVLFFGQNIQHSIQFLPVNIADYSNVEFSISLATGEGAGPGIDLNENLVLEYSTDCGATWIPVDTMAGGDDTQFAWDQTLVGFTGNTPFNNGCCDGGTYAGGPDFCGSCGNSTCPSCLQAAPIQNPFTMSVPAGADNFSFRLSIFRNDGTPVSTSRTAGDELFYLDDVLLTGTYNGSKPNVNLTQTGGDCTTDPEFTAEVTGGFSSPTECNTKYHYFWYVNGALQGSDVSDQTTEVRTLNGLADGDTVLCYVYAGTGTDNDFTIPGGCSINGAHSNRIVYALPSALPDGDLNATKGNICLGESTTLIFDLQGDPPLEIQYSVNGNPPVTESNIYGDPFFLEVTPGSAGVTTYELLQVSNAQCANTNLSGATNLNVTVEEVPTVPTLGSDELLCANATTIIDIGNTSAPSHGGNWTILEEPAAGASFDNGDDTVFDNELQNVSAGTYILEWISYNGFCEATDQIAYTLLEDPVMNDPDFTQGFCGAAAVISGSPPGVGSGQWVQTSGPAATILTPNQSTTEIQGLSTGNVYEFEWQITNGPCGPVAQTVTLDGSGGTGTPGLWTGSLDGDWQNCANWDNLQVPDATTNVTINNTAANALDLSTVGVAEVRSLSLNTDPSNQPTGQLDGILTINETLTLTDGLLITDNAGIVKVTNSDPFSALSYTFDSWVFGRLTRAVQPGNFYEFPVGTQTDPQVAQLSLSGAFAGPDEISCVFVAPSPQEAVPGPNNVDFSATFNFTTDGGYWDLQGNSAITNGTFDLTLQKRNYNPKGKPAYTIVRDGNPWILDLANTSFNGTLENAAFLETSRTGYSSLGKFNAAFSEQPMPVELLFLRAYCASECGAVQLRWATASETNNDRFELLRSVDGRRFNKIGEITGAGSTSEWSAYEYLDENLPPRSNVLYYRLNQIDFDGTATLSNIASVEIDRSAPFDRVIRIYPNPAGAYFTLECRGVSSVTITARLFNSSGQVVFAEMVEPEGGAALSEFDLSGLSSGVYSLQLILDDEVVVERIVKE